MPVVRDGLRFGLRGQAMHVSGVLLDLAAEAALPAGGRGTARVQLIHAGALSRSGCRRSRRHASDLGSAVGVADRRSGTCADRGQAG